MKTWFITGCSSGFGKVLAEAVLARGDQVVVTARDTHTIADFSSRYPQTARVAKLDVCREGDARKAVRDAIEAFGGIDVLVNNAGFGLIGAIEEGTPEEYRPIYETNVFGMIETTRAVLPILRARGSGRIINISSVAGIAGRAGVGYYNGTKFAVEGISEALAEEVEPLGIRVIIVEPGRLRTEFLGRSIKSTELELAAYTGTAGKSRAHRDISNGKQDGDPHKAVSVLLKAVDSDQPPLHLPLGRDSYDRIRAKFAAFERDMATWEEEAIATEFAC